MLILTSFKHSKKYPCTKFSVARFQPKGYAYPELRFLAAEGLHGEKLLLRGFSDPLIGYVEALKAGFKARWPQIQQWLDSLRPEKDIALCCWCPYSQSAQKQIREWGTFACHTGLIGRMVETHRPDIPIFLDDDRTRYLVPAWKPLRAVQAQEKLL